MSDRLCGRDQGIAAEPHLRPGTCRPDPTEDRAARVVAADDEEEWIRHGIADEPVLAGATVGAGYAAYLDRMIAGRSRLRCWGVSALTVLVSGLAAIVMTIFGGASFTGAGYGQILHLVLLGPVVEEVAKIAILFWLAEQRPWLLLGPGHILAIALASGFGFASIENLLYLTVYIKDPTAGMIHWRLVVCTALHVVCTTIAGLGIIRVWRDPLVHRRRARPERILMALIVACVVHGVYNASALTWEMITRVG